MTVLHVPHSVVTVLHVPYSAVTVLHVAHSVVTVLLVPYSAEAVARLDVDALANLAQISQSRPDSGLGLSHF